MVHPSVFPQERSPIGFTKGGPPRVFSQKLPHSGVPKWVSPPGVTLGEIAPELSQKGSPTRGLKRSSRVSPGWVNHRGPPEFIQGIQSRVPQICPPRWVPKGIPQVGSRKRSSQGGSQIGVRKWVSTREVTEYGPPSVVPQGGPQRRVPQWWSPIVVNPKEFQHGTSKLGPQGVPRGFPKGGSQFGSTGGFAMVGSPMGAPNGAPPGAVLPVGSPKRGPTRGDLLRGFHQRKSHNGCPLGVSTRVFPKGGPQKGPAKGVSQGVPQAESRRGVP